MRGLDGNETCPRCYHVMIDLARFDPLMDAHAAGPDKSEIQNLYWWDEDFFIDMLNRPIERFRAWRERRRLERILRAFPASLHCTGCGFTLKRR